MRKNHSTQMIECKKAGLTGDGEFMSFKEHPEFLPRHPWRTKLKPMMDAIKSGEMTGIQLVACLRFGGTCSNQHPECKKLRGTA